MSLWKSCPAIEPDPEKVSGAWVFCGPRIPVASLFENLRDGATVDRFPNWFPGVESWQVESVLDHESRDSKISSGITDEGGNGHDRVQDW